VLHHNDCTLSVKRKHDFKASTTKRQIVLPGVLKISRVSDELDKLKQKPENLTKVEF
jgi:hypothetical protein